MVFAGRGGSTVGWVYSVPTSMYCMLRSVLHLLCATLVLSASGNEENTAEDPDDVFVPSGIVRTRSFGTFKHEFKLSDATDFIISGTEVCIHMYICTYIHTVW